MGASRRYQDSRDTTEVSAGQGGPALVKFLVAYEDFATGHSAMRICDNLVRNLGQEFQSQTASWKFEILRVSKLAGMAAQDALEADVVIISAHGGAGLPAEVMSWLEGWQSQRPQAAKALVALLDHGEERAQPQFQVRRYLEEFARQGDFSFFFHVCPTSGLDAEYSAQPAGRRAEPRPWAMVPNPRRFPSRQWGINE